MVSVVGQPVNCDIACEEILKFLFSLRTGRPPEYVWLYICCWKQFPFEIFLVIACCTGAAVLRQESVFISRLRQPENYFQFWSIPANIFNCVHFPSQDLQTLYAECFSVLGILSSEASLDFTWGLVIDSWFTFTYKKLSWSWHRCIVGLSLIRDTLLILLINTKCRSEHMESIVKTQIVSQKTRLGIHNTSDAQHSTVEVTRSWDFSSLACTAHWKCKAGNCKVLCDFRQ